MLLSVLVPYYSSVLGLAPCYYLLVVVLVLDHSTQEFLECHSDYYCCYVTVVSCYYYFWVMLVMVDWGVAVLRGDIRPCGFANVCSGDLCCSSRPTYSGSNAASCLSCRKTCTTSRLCRPRHRLLPPSWIHGGNVRAQRVYSYTLLKSMLLAFKRGLTEV